MSDVRFRKTRNWPEWKVLDADGRTIGRVVRVWLDDCLWYRADWQLRRRLGHDFAALSLGAAKRYISTMLCRV